LHQFVVQAIEQLPCIGRIDALVSRPHLVLDPTLVGFRQMSADVANFVNFSKKR
jgi:hypothetical protein